MGRFGFGWVSFCCLDHLGSVWERSSSAHKPEKQKLEPPPYLSALLLQWRAVALSALQSSWYERQQRQDTEMDSSWPHGMFLNSFCCVGEKH